MDTVEARNLNRLRRGKMLLEYSKVKKSYIIYTLLLVYGFWAGLHRFYLGHKRIGIAILSIPVFILLSFTAGFVFDAHEIFDLTGFLMGLLIIIFVIELVLMTSTVGRENARIQTRLASEYDIKDYKVIP